MPRARTHFGQRRRRRRPPTPPPPRRAAPVAVGNTTAYTQGPPPRVGRQRVVNTDAINARGVGWPLANQAGANDRNFAIAQLGDTLSGDIDAIAAVNTFNVQFNPNAPFTNEFLDAIIFMQPGYRTRADIPHLRGCPLGLLVYFLMMRMVEGLGMTANQAVMNLRGLSLNGIFCRIQNERRDIQNMIPNPRAGEEGQNPFIPGPARVELTKVVSLYNFSQLLLDKVSFQWLLRLSPAEALARSPLAYLDTRVDDLNEYMRLMSAPAGGSDMTFFVFTQDSYLYRRYHNPTTRGGGGALNTRVVRTAGLRQVLYKSLESVIPDLDFPYTLYIPSGRDGNCFQGSLRWVFEKHSSQNFDDLWYQMMKRGGGRCKISAEKFEKRYKTEGYPTTQLRLLAKDFSDMTGMEVQYWYRRYHRSKEEGEWVNLLKGIYITLHMVTLLLFQCEDTGLIRDDMRRHQQYTQNECELYYNSMNDGDLGRMTHCIGVHPTPTPNEWSNGKWRKNFVEKINTISKPFFDTMYERKKYWEDIQMEDIECLVEAQEARYKALEVNTLIFNPESKFKTDDGDAASRKNEKVWKQKLWEKNGSFPEYYVIAYDLETITNELCLHEQRSGFVYEPFRNRFEDLDFTPFVRFIYEPGELSQIPFSAQWVAVNVSDRGVYLQRKEDTFTEGMINTITTYEVDSSSEDPEFFLSETFTEDAEGLLGKCVEDMLIHIASFVHHRKGHQAVCYAHNGAHFDAYIVLQFQRFEITSILKTSRGVMTVSLRVPIAMDVFHIDDYDYRVHDLETPKITIILRDTMLHVPGSLARLCKGFNVPSKYCKLDFPIQMVNKDNFNHPTISPMIRSYGENDVKALAVIIVRINELIGSSPWKPANVNSLKPPIAQFVTCMGMIRESTRLHFKRELPFSFHPQAIDIPALRIWLQNATIGGRVSAYAKTYTSLFAGDIMKAYNEGDVEMLKDLYTRMISYHQCTQVLDFTSLYPFAMDSCPMPTGRLHSLTVNQCKDAIQAVHCDECDKKMSLCSTHRCTYTGEMNLNCILRPFCIIIVKNVAFTKRQNKRNFCPRKSFLSSNSKATGLLYSLESDDEYKERMKGLEETHKTQSFSNVDLYWMDRQGFVFDIVGGFGFEVTPVYNLFIGPAFKQRIQAKKDGNKLLSDFLKLNYNGSFGITTQQDIVDSFFITRLEDKYYRCDPRDPDIRNAISASKDDCHDNRLFPTDELTGEAYYLPSGQAIIQKRKKEHLSEFYADQSPMQIGAAVLSWSRHIANLVMFNLGEEDQLYTDTDSIQMNDRVTTTIPALAALICNRDDAPLGSLKNDHGEGNGTEPRIFFSMIGTKKVKCHMTLNKEGEVRVFNTFKGLNVATTLEEGEKVMKHPDYAEYICTKTLMELNIQSKSEPVTVTSWKRDLQTGVTISNHLQNLSPTTYLENCKGTSVKRKEYGTVEFFIPHGCIVVPDFPVYQDEEGCLTQGSIRKDRLLDNIWVGIESLEVVNTFIEKYYKHAVEGKYEGPDNPEYRAILEKFYSIKE